MCLQFSLILICDCMSYLLIEQVARQQLDVPCLRGYQIKPSLIVSRFQGSVSKYKFIFRFCSSFFSVSQVSHTGMLFFPKYGYWHHMVIRWYRYGCMALVRLDQLQTYGLKPRSKQPFYLYFVSSFRHYFHHVFSKIFV